MNRFVQFLIAWRVRALASRQAFVWHFGVIGFGVLGGLAFSIFLVNSDDIANHALWEKALIVVGMTLVVGPITGWLWGHAMWVLKPIWETDYADLASHQERIAQLERRVAELEKGPKREP